MFSSLPSAWFLYWGVCLSGRESLRVWRDFGLQVWQGAAANWWVTIAARAQRRPGVQTGPSTAPRWPYPPLIGSSGIIVQGVVCYGEPSKACYFVFLKLFRLLPYRPNVRVTVGW
jgi:hypothetical protein